MEMKQDFMLWHKTIAFLAHRQIIFQHT